MSILVNPFRHSTGGEAPGGGGGAPAFGALGTAVFGTASAEVAWPTHTTNDIGILFIKTSNTAVPATPAGCSPIYTPTGSGTISTSGSVRLYAYWIRATSSAMPAIETGDSGATNYGVIMTFTNCRTTGSPIEATATSLSTGSTAVSIPGLTTLGAERMIVAAVGLGLPDGDEAANISGWANASLSSVTERLDATSGQGLGGGFAAATGIKATAGAVSATTATLALSSRQERLSFALIPA